MRDPNRIDGYCDRMKAIWGKVPDWRFGQMMMNIMCDYLSETSRDVFYLEDEELFAWMEKYMDL